MLSLSQNAKETRVAWLVMVDDKYLFLTRSGIGYKSLGETYKKLSTLSAQISLETFNQLENSVMFVAEI